MSVDRFETPLYGLGEAAGYLAVPPSTFATWAYGYQRRRAGDGVIVARPVITAVRPAHRHEAAVPFIGLAEAYALAAFRQAGVPMQRIRPAIDALDHELGLKYAWLAGVCIRTGRRSCTTTLSTPGIRQKVSLPANSW